MSEAKERYLIMLVVNKTIVIISSSASPPPRPLPPLIHQIRLPHLRKKAGTIKQRRVCSDC